MSSSPTRVRLCAALLRIADECHITDDRIPQDYQVLKARCTDKKRPFANKMQFATNADHYLEAIGVTVPGATHYSGNWHGVQNGPIFN